MGGAAKRAGLEDNGGSLGGHGRYGVVFRKDQERGHKVFSR